MQRAFLGGNMRLEFDSVDACPSGCVDKGMRHAKRAIMGLRHFSDDYACGTF
jgi:hypothetical protein